MMEIQVAADTARAESARYEWLKKADDTVIPMMPAVAHRVIELVSDPDVSIATIAALVSKDQVLASRVLGLANSAYCAPMQTVSTVLEAIVRLGTSAVRNVVVTVSFTSRMHDPRIYGDQAKELADHAIGTAYVGRLVAEKANVDEDEAFLCGLLHDIGKLVVLKLAHDWSYKKGEALPPDQIETAMIARHAQLGGITLKRWKLPESLIEPVTYHHDYTQAKARPRETAAAYAANLLSHRYGFGCPANGREILSDPVAEYLGLDANWLEATDVHAPGLYEVARQILN
jgi:putative nucleotidyltransferase with HDIG domain